MDSIDSEQRLLRLRDGLDWLDVQILNELLPTRRKLGAATTRPYAAVPFAG